MKIELYGEQFNISLSPFRYTIVVGGSSQGKTLFISFLSRYIEENGYLIVDGFKFEVAANYHDVLRLLEKEMDTLIFVDESVSNTLGRIPFSKLDWGANNHLIIMCRDDVKYIGYGLFDRYKMERVSSHEHQLIPIDYTDIFRKIELRPSLVLCEDAGLGFTLLESALPKEFYTIKAVKGRTKILSSLELVEDSAQTIVVVSDLCGLDGLSEQIVSYISSHLNIKIIRSRSFEYDLLKYLGDLNGLDLRVLFTSKLLKYRNEEVACTELLKQVILDLYGIVYSKGSSEVFDLLVTGSFKRGKGVTPDTSLSWLYPEIPRGESGVKRMNFS